MLETEFIRSIHSNYERVHLPDKPDEQRYQYCILTRGGIRGLLPCSLRYINGDAYLYYDITSRQNVAQLYAKQTIDRKWFRDFMWNYEQVCQELGRFLLDEKNILVYPEQIFEDLGNRNFYFLYLPYSEEDNGFGTFLEFVLEHMDYEDLELVERVYSIYEQYEKYGDVYLQGQLFEDAAGLTVNESVYTPTESSISIEGEEIGQEDFLVGKFQQQDSISDAEDIKEKKGLWGKLGKKRKKYEENRKHYREKNLSSMEVGAVAEESEYEEDYGRTVYIEQKSEEQGIHKLYTPDGRLVARIDKEIFTIGKHRGEVDMVLEDDTISRLHARIYKDEELIYLEDLNSTNGTFKNGLRLQPYEKRRLEEGDEVRLGKLLFVYR